MAQTAQLIEALKQALKAAKLTYADVARGLGVSEATVKRMFSKGDFSLHRLEQVCGVLKLEVSDLAELATEASEPFSSLTPAQEEALLADPRLMLLAFLVLSHWQFADIVQTFKISEHEAIQLLAKLDRLGMIDLLPGNRIKLLTARNFTWRKDGSVQQFFEKEVLRDFLHTHFHGEREDLKFVAGLLSANSLQHIQQSVMNLVREFDELVEADRVIPFEDRHSCAALFCSRPWEFSRFASLRRVTDVAKPGSGK